MPPSVSSMQNSSPKEAEKLKRGVLDWIKGVLKTGTDEEEEADLSGLLRGLAKVFAATGAGLAAPLPGPFKVKYQAWADGQTRSEPPALWAEQPDLLKQVGQEVTALAVQAKDGTSWLLTTVWLPQQDGLFWVQGDSKRNWSAADKELLPMAAQVLARQAFRSSRSWARALECANQQRYLEANAVLISRLAHEFGNILTGILGFSELSLSQLAPDSLPHRYVKEVHQAAQGGAIWVHKLQLFSRRARPPFWPTTLGTVAARVEARVRPAWGSDLAFLLALPSDLPPLAIDTDSLQQILEPLLDNAREAITGKGVVTLSARQVDLTEVEVQEILGKVGIGRYLEITITDTGAGFNPETQRRLFAEMFFSTKRRYCGLGLAMAYGLLQTFGGGLRFGPHPEQGTAVSIFLPVAVASPVETALPPPQGPVASPSRNARILVIDDDRLVLEFVATVLQKAGYAVRTAPGPTEALALFNSPQEKFHLIVTDVVMPEMNGFDMARRMLKLDPDTNLLFISNFPSTSTLIPGDLLKKYVMLRKPFDPNTLLQAVAQSLARSKPS